jgi:HAD superfamily hydrolase (TIGR01509 family)
MPRPAARPSLLFDLDGTLVHTDPVHLRAFNAMLALHGRSIDLATYNREVSGFANDDILARMFPDLPVAAHRQLADFKEKTFRDMIGALPPQPGLLALLASAAAAGVPCAVVTNAPRANAQMMRAALGLLDGWATIVLGDELARAKPDPLPYLTALEIVRGDPARSVAFEDSRSGVRAAAGAGLPVVGMTTSQTQEDLVGEGAMFGADDFTDTRLRALVAERTGLAWA